MGYDCGCKTIDSTAVAVSGGIMTITVVPLQQYDNYEAYMLCVGEALPPHTGIEPVDIFDGANIFPLLDSNAQPVVAGVMRGHRRYAVRFGAGGLISTGTIPPHLTCCHGLCCMEYSSNAALQITPEVGG